MSDDTPTERFIPPTQPAPANPEIATHPEKPKSKGLIIALSIIGGVLLIAVVILLTLLFARGTGGVSPEPSTSPNSQETPSPSPSVTPSPSNTPSPSPSTEPSPSKPPVTTGPVFNSFAPANNESVGCTSDSGQVSVTFTWTSTGANEAAIGVGTTDAFVAPYQTGLPPSGSFDLNYQCTEASQVYTVSIKGGSGQTNNTITLKR